MKQLLVFVLIVACVAAESTTENEPSTQPKNLNCIEQGNTVISCLFVKVAMAIDKAARGGNIHISDGIAFERVASAKRFGKNIQRTEAEVIKELPNNEIDKLMSLMILLYDSTVDFIQTHELRVSRSENSLALILAEGRAKMKKIFSPLLSILGYKVATIIPIFLGGLALLVSKALVIAKVVLFIVGYSAFQQIFGSADMANVFNKNPTPTFMYDNNPQTWYSQDYQMPNTGYKMDNTQSNHDIIYPAYKQSNIVN